MTVIFTMEITTEIDRSQEDTADRCIVDEDLKQRWIRKVEKETSKAIPNADVICTNIQVFDCE